MTKLQNDSLKMHATMVDEMVHGNSMTIGSFDGTSKVDTTNAIIEITHALLEEEYVQESKSEIEVEETVIPHEVCSIELQSVSFVLHTPTYDEDVIKRDDKFVVKEHDVDECIGVSKSACVSIHISSSPLGLKSDEWEESIPHVDYYTLSNQLLVPWDPGVLVPKYDEGMKAIRSFSFTVPTLEEKHLELENQLKKIFANKKGSFIVDSKEGKFGTMETNSDFQEVHFTLVKSLSNLEEDIPLLKSFWLYLKTWISHSITSMKHRIESDFYNNCVCCFENFDIHGVVTEAHKKAWAVYCDEELHGSC